MNIARIQEKFVGAMVKNGIVPSDPVQVMADGTIHRFHVKGDKSSSNNGWAVIFTDGVAAGAYGSHKLGKKFTWCSRDRSTLTATQRSTLCAHMQEAKRLRNQLDEERHTKARKIAIADWQAAKPASARHKYLKRKGVGVHGLKEANGKLLIPIRDADGKLWSIQKIDGDGEKRYQKNGRKRGCFCLLGGPITFKVNITEGYATAATCFEVTGVPTVMAGDSGSLKSVAQAIRAKYPLVEIMVAADNEWAKPKAGEENSGLNHAKDAAQAVDGRVAIPIFDQGEATEDASDFNDLFHISGKKAVLKAFAKARTVVPKGGREAFGMNAGDLISLPSKPKKNLIGPWLPKGGLCEIHSWRGVGKTLMRDALTAHGVCGLNFLCWKIDRPISVLIVDGEMPQADVKIRIEAAIKSVKKKPIAPWRVVTRESVVGGPIDLRDPVWQETITREAASSQLIFLDNVATLAGDIGDSNDAKSWSPVQSWMTKMRDKGHAIVWLHNDGKAGEQLGTSVRELVLDSVLQLTVRTKKPLDNATVFGVVYKKHRWFFGKDAVPFTVRVGQSAVGCQEWSWSNGKGKSPKGHPKYAEVMKLHKAKKSLREIEELTGVSKSTVERWVMRASKKSD